MRTIAISDPHGHAKELRLLLEKVAYQPKVDRLYFLGDYGDRGSESKEVVQLVMALCENENVKAIGGNHDDMFLAWLEGRDFVPNPFLNYRNGGLDTLYSYYPDYKIGVNDNEARAYIKETYHAEIAFLRSLPTYIEDDFGIFVHAGINPELPNWKDTTIHDFRWIRKPFHLTAHPANKPVIFGHTPVHKLRDDPNCADVWFSEGKIGIDGGVAFGRQLNALIIEDGNVNWDSVQAESA